MLKRIISMGMAIVMAVTFFCLTANANGDALYANNDLVLYLIILCPIFLGHFQDTMSTATISMQRNRISRQNAQVRIAHVVQKVGLFRNFAFSAHILPVWSVYI